MTLISSRSPSHDALSAYTRPRIRRGLLDIVTSAGAYLALCVAMYLILRVSPFLAVALVIPTAGFLVRVFVMFHDCVHGSLLPTKWLTAELHACYFYRRGGRLRVAG